MALSLSLYRDFIDELGGANMLHWHESHGAATWAGAALEARNAFFQEILGAFARSGYVHIELPSHIEADQFERQTDHFVGLSPYVYSVTTASSQRHFILRPTSEVPFTSLFMSMIAEGRALPFLFVQNVTVYRDEDITKCIPLIRQCEISPFVETYTMVSGEDAAEHRVDLETYIYASILKRFGITALRVRRPREDTFPEARYTIAFDAPLPGGSTTQVATVHHLGDSFAKALGESGRARRLLQTSTGISCRAFGVALFLAWHRNGRSLAEALSELTGCLNSTSAGALSPVLDTFLQLLCCDEPSCIRRVELQEDERVLGWDLDGTPAKCGSCGKVTKPLLLGYVI